MCCLIAESLISREHLGLTNISIMNLYPHLWKVLLKDMKVVHYTLRKPFIEPKPGIFKEPYDLWNKLYQEMNAKINLKKIEKLCH